MLWTFPPPSCITPARRQGGTLAHRHQLPFPPPPPSSPPPEGATERSLAGAGEAFSFPLPAALGQTDASGSGCFADPGRGGVAARLRGHGVVALMARRVGRRGGGGVLARRWRLLLCPPAARAEGDLGRGQPLYMVCWPVGVGGVMVVAPAQWRLGWLASFRRLGHWWTGGGCPAGVQSLRW